eukprot:1469146-Pleurochrysis_carterae.AAC.5
MQRSALDCQSHIVSSISSVSSSVRRRVCESKQLPPAFSCEWVQTPADVGAVYRAGLPLERH